MARMLAPIEVLKLYPPHDGTLAGLVRSRAARGGQREFLRFEERSLSWSEFERESARTAAALAANGIRRGDRVAVMSANCVEMVLLLFGAARLGAILVPVNAEFGVEEARYVIEHCGASAVFCSHVVYDTAREASKNTAAWLVRLDEFDLWLQSPPAGKEQSTPAGAPDDTCIIVYTSGTTGFPKGVMHSQRSYVLTAEAFVERMHLQPDERMLCILPLFHINALFYSLGGAVAAGATLILVRRFSASTFWRTAADTRATEVNMLAAVGNILARRPREEFMPHELRKVYGSPVSAMIEKTFREEFGIPLVIEGYGMSEIPGACNNPIAGENRIGSMGTAALHPDHSMAFAELKVVDDEGKEVPDGETGELVCRTPIIMQGYFRDLEQTKAAFRDGWFLTGDLARRDRDGYFWFVARKKDIIRRRGENVSGAELDRIIGEHPSVVEAAAIAVPSELGEDDILVAVVEKPGATVTPAEIAAWCRQRLAPSKQPRFVAIVPSLPHTPSHRVAKFRLKDDPSIRSAAVEV
jgi:carnitine-CoA ligase